ncbi:transposase, partial [Enterococcus faecium]
AEYTAYYKKKYAETPKHKHKRAIVLTARKFTRLVDTLLRNHQLYMPPRSVIDK